MCIIFMLKTDKQLKHNVIDDIIGESPPNKTMIVMVYGTLKRGFYNHNWMEENTYLGKVVLRGYKMYTNEHYTAIVKGGNQDDEIIGELYEINSDVFDSIAAMEFRAGYHINEIGLEVNGNKIIVPVFAMDKEQIDDNWKLIENGIYE